MSTWLLEPRDTLLLRDARPSLAGAGALRTLDFPWPSSLAGLIRTQIGTGSDGRFDSSLVESVKRVALRGPLLVQLDASNAIAETFVPAPHDCFWYRNDTVPDERFVRRRLHPIDIRKHMIGAQTDLDGGRIGRSLNPELLVGYEEGEVIAKPIRGPAFWRWTDFISWLKEPCGETTLSSQDFTSFGLPPLAREQRVHVSINANAQTAQDGALFMTEMLRFMHWPKGKSPAQLALMFDCTNPDEGKRPLTPGCVTFGGDRRLSWLRQLPKGTLPSAPKFPDSFYSASVRLARVLLLTPALFESGFAPHFIGDERVRVVAAAVPRAQVVSGWDFAATPPCPKPNRRMAPAGSVYWVEIPSDVDAEQWIDKVWMRCLSNQISEQDSLDGFGLCAVGAG